MPTDAPQPLSGAKQAGEESALVKELKLHFDTSTKALTEQFTKSVKVVVGSVQEDVKTNADNIKRIQESIKKIEQRPTQDDIQKQIEEAINGLKKNPENGGGMDKIE